MQEKNLLVTAFAPFGGETVNAAQLAVEALPERVGGWRLDKLTLPVVFGLAAETAIAHCGAQPPQAVLCVGQAAGRDAVTPELVAVNLRYGRIPDNAGVSPQDEPVLPGGENALFATLPVRQMTEAAAAQGLPCRLSTTAGLYVCNDLFYGLLAHFQGTGTRVAFIHVPVTPAQGAPSLETAVSAAVLEALIRAIPEA